MRITQTAISKKWPALFGTSPILDEDWDDLACPPTVLRSIANADFHPSSHPREAIPSLRSHIHHWRPPNPNRPKWKRPKLDEIPVSLVLIDEEWVPEDMELRQYYAKQGVFWAPKDERLRLPYLKKIAADAHHPSSELAHRELQEHRVLT